VNVLTWLSGIRRGLQVRSRRRLRIADLGFDVHRMANLSRYSRSDPYLFLRRLSRRVVDAQRNALDHRRHGGTIGVKKPKPESGK